MLLSFKTKSVTLSKKKKYKDVFVVNKYSSDIKDKISQDISRKMGVGLDVIKGCIIIKITGNNAIHIENYWKINSYDDECIILQDKYKKVIIKGNKLAIKYFFDGDMDITGKIISINFEGIR